MAMGAEVVAGGAREEVLRRIRAAIGEGSLADAAEIRGEVAGAAARLQADGVAAAEAILELLEDRLRDYDASVVRAKAGEVGAEIARFWPSAASGGWWCPRGWRRRSANRCRRALSLWLTMG
jgi:hypothetical protein